MLLTLLGGGLGGMYKGRTFCHSDSFRLSGVRGRMGLGRRVCPLVAPLPAPCYKGCSREMLFRTWLAGSPASPSFISGGGGPSYKVCTIAVIVGVHGG